VANVIGNDAAYPTAAIKAGAINDMVDARYVPVSGNGNPQGVATIPASARTAQATAASSTALSSGELVSAALVTFTNLTTGGSTPARANADRWRISITGAQRNQVVSVSARKDSGPESSSNYGTTDGAGTWSLEGTSSAADAGTWLEIWKVGGAVVGQIAVTILPPATPTTGTTAATGSSPGTAAPGRSQGSSGNVPPSESGTSDGLRLLNTDPNYFATVAKGVPWYAWLIGVFVVYKVVAK
jgi:hypothetical protein